MPLLANDSKVARERLTLIRVFEELRALGYDGGYDAVRRYTKAWQKDRGAVTLEAYVPLTFAPGEAYQFDWSHEIVLINGTTVTVKVAHVRLCHSRMMFARAYPRETQEMVFDAHDRAFAFFKGACTRGIYDNIRRRWSRSSSARIAPITVASCKCAAIILSSRRRARRHRAGKRARSRTRSVLSASASSRPGFV
jgi:transposase